MELPEPRDVFSPKDIWRCQLLVHWTDAAAFLLRCVWLCVRAAAQGAIRVRVRVPAAPLELCNN